MAYLFVSASSQSLSNPSSSPVTAYPLTISAWVKCTTFTGRAVCVSNGSGLTMIGINASGQCEAFTRDDSLTQQATALTATTAATTGTWHHIAGIFPSTTSRTAYLNGVASATNTFAITNSINAYTKMSIGSRFIGTLDSFMNGNIADVGIWNTALTPDEILSLSKGFSCRKIRPNSLRFYAPLIRGALDYSGAIVLTNTNGATISEHPRIIL